MLTVARWQLLPPALKTPFLGFCKKRLMWQIYTFFFKKQIFKNKFSQNIFQLFGKTGKRAKFGSS